MIRLIFIFCACIYVQSIFAADAVVHTSYGTFQLGKKPYSPGTRERFIQEKRALPAPPDGTILLSTSPRGYANNTADLPPIGNQGSEGSCVHFAGTYAVKSYYMNQIEGGGLITVTPASPRFTYNLTNSGDDNGGYGHEPFEIFMRFGCPTLDQLPYTAGQYSFLPDIEDFREGLHRRTESYVWLYDWQPTAAQITQLKNILDAGNIGVVGVNASDWNFSTWGSDGDYTPYSGSACSFYDIDHMVCLCGYGDGWYLIANSWGTSFGSNGFIYVDANYFENYVSDFMYPIEGSYAASTHRLECSITHPYRSQITDMNITINGASTWNYAPLSPEMPGDTTYSSDLRNDVDVAIDISDAGWPVTSGTLSFSCKDTGYGSQGTLDDVRVITPDNVFISSETPVSIPDDNGSSAEVIFSLNEPPVALFISEYAEGSANVHYLEVYNPGDVSCDLSQWSIAGIANGGEWYESMYPLSGTLPPAGVFVIALTNSTATVLSHADMIVPAIPPFTFDGNDAIGLAYCVSDTVRLCDTVGRDGASPAYGWDVAGTSEGTYNHTLIRGEYVSEGTIDWESARGTSPASSEWKVYGIDYTDNIGIHNLPEPLGLLSICFMSVLFYIRGL